ncbi:MAG TPA: DNA methyltransferase, partial [Bryobacteraceae bacterium]|nr:DNA methyltransferase [Bryobacteraceae bacterium]
VRRWKTSGAAERANYQLFLSELCDVLNVLRPNPTVPDDSQNAYVFERAVHFHNGDGTTSFGRIDLYKRGCFVLEAKQGSDQIAPATPARTRRGTAIRQSPGWDEAMLAARNQAERYAKAVPDGWPPFLITVDVGYSIELFADFSLTGKNYAQFPDRNTYRIGLDELTSSNVRDRLRSVWLDPLSLDPTRISARVTRGVASKLAELAKDLEEDHSAASVAGFLMRCIFTSFAEDVHLLPADSWTNFLESLRGNLANFCPMVESLWQTMNSGGFSPILREHILHFNGGLFESVQALPLTSSQLELLIRASKADWKDVEPSIFGTLLERALDKDERHRLGAHYTPREYVERLVIPTVIQPLRDDWKTVQATAVKLARDGNANAALEAVRTFRKDLCNLRVLDPACGSGNFLYVTLEHLKRLEGEVIETLEQLGETQLVLHETGFTVDPHQLLGLELNPRAAIITDLVLWIGYLQWYFRTWGSSTTPPEPVIKRFHNIEARDALLVYDREEPVRDEHGKIRTQWDQRTMREHPVTREEVPDENARRTIYEYINARRAPWPEADFIVGNPPFIGNWMMRRELGDGYAETLREIYAEVPESAEYVMYWWHRAADTVRSGPTRHFGFISTNSLRQTFSRRVVAYHLQANPPLSLVYAIPDHPWVDSRDGADVRISMTVGEAGRREGVLARVTRELPGPEHAEVDLSERRGIINPDLTVGPNLVAAHPLKANDGVSCRGVSLHGAGFIVTPAEAKQLGLGRIRGLERHIREYRNGRDLNQLPRGVMVIDLFGLSAEEVRTRFPEVYQWVHDRVKPERDHNNRPSYRDNWWIHGEPRRDFRPALAGLQRYISTVETSKHRFFVFLDASILPDNKLVNIALEDAYFLGVLSSHAHVVWALAAGGWLGVGNDPVYVKTRCFEPFPFPDATESQRQRIRELGEALDAHRKRRQQLHPELRLTEMYNVLEKLRAGVELSEDEHTIHEQGLISVLRGLHDDLDSVVLNAYGWPANLTTEEILYKLVALNEQRQAEERRGIIRWLRPEFQQTPQMGQAALGIEMEEAPAPVAARRAWPATLPERVRCIRSVLAEQQQPLDAPTLARIFKNARRMDVEEIAETLVSLRQARRVNNRYTL